MHSVWHAPQVAVNISEVGTGRSSKCMQQFGISAGGPSGPSGSHLVSQSALLPFWSLHVACLDLFSVGWMKCDCFGPDCFYARARPRGPSIWQTNIGEAGRPVAVSLQNVIQATGCSHVVWGYFLSVVNLWPTYVMFCLYNITNKQKKYYLDNNIWMPRCILIQYI